MTIFKNHYSLICKDCNFSALLYQLDDIELCSHNIKCCNCNSQNTKLIVRNKLVS